MGQIQRERGQEDKSLTSLSSAVGEAPKHTPSAASFGGGGYSRLSLSKVPNVTSVTSSPSSSSWNEMGMKGRDSGMKEGKEERWAGGQAGWGREDPRGELESGWDLGEAAGGEWNVEIDRHRV